jgi:hypothetical protein
VIFFSRETYRGHGTHAAAACIHHIVIALIYPAYFSQPAMASSSQP